MNVFDRLAQNRPDGRPDGLRRALLFGFLYFVQGSLLAYVLAFNNLYLRAFGASARQLALLNGLLVVPFILKVGIGLVSDRVNLLGRGHRVPYISLGSILIAAGALAALTLNPVAQYPLFTLVAFTMAMGLAFYDTTVDGLAIDVTPAAERSLIQGSMVIGRAIGLVVMAAIYGRLITALGWQVVFWILAAYSLVPFLVLGRIREPVRRDNDRGFDRGALRDLWRPAIRWLSLYAVINSAVVYGANGIITLFLNEGLQQSIAEVGDTAAFAGLGTLLGAFVATATARRLNIWRQGQITIVLVATLLLTLALIASPRNVQAVVLVWGFCLAAAEVIYVTVAMINADPRLGAGTFAIYMAISNVSIGFSQAITTSLIDTVDFRWIFAALGILNLVLFPILDRLKQTSRPVSSLQPGTAEPL